MINILFFLAVVVVFVLAREANAAKTLRAVSSDGTPPRVELSFLGFFEFPDRPGVEVAELHSCRGCGAV